MSIKKVEIRPKDNNGDYNDIVYPKTSSDMVVHGNTSVEETISDIEQGISDNEQEISDHKSDKSNPHGVTKSQIGLSKVENKNSEEIRTDSSKDSKVKVSSGASTTGGPGGMYYQLNNNSGRSPGLYVGANYGESTRRIPFVSSGDSEPENNFGEDGDIYFQY